MNPFIFYVSLLALVLLLTTCHKSEACPLLAETRPAVGLVPANGDGLPYYGPQGSLFPQPVPGAIDLPPQAVTVPLPTGSGLMQFLQLIGTFVVAWLLRSQNRIMSPPE
jgi:hypothetical protein